MKSIRRIHGWIGVLFAPSLLVFALSGLFQMYGCHEGDGADQPAGWIVRLAQIHMKQTVTAPRKRPPRPQPNAAPAVAPSPAPAAERPSPPTTAPLRLFFAAMTIGLLASTLLGLAIALTSKRDRALHVGLLVAGVAVPILLMML